MSIADVLDWMDLLKEKYGIACPVTFESDEAEVEVPGE